MAKKTKKSAAVVVKKGNPSLQGVPWKEPYPEAEMDDEGVDKVIVRCIPTQDLRINGTVRHAGVETTMPCSVAHAHANALSSPKE